ncbi:MAG: asparagine synthase (glutamine-hydrolyzing) [Anaerolineae bacterium]
MCGICGIANLQSHAPVDEALLHRMTASITHRGPDEDGFYCRDFVGMGMRRLSIIDLSTGQQPIPNEDHTCWIVYNGEIYNYRELREYLLKRGHVFRTHADTEVILHLYEDFGDDCVQHLNGIFAFAIWDQNREELFLARDRMGIKPLYYAEVEGQLVFGSELKVLMQHPAIKRDIDLIALNEYLSYEYVPSPRTILRGISRLESGHSLRFSQAKGVRLRRYWDVDLSRSETQGKKGWRDYNLLEVLRQSVKQELVSDVPVGVLLSGGVDSSTVAALMAQLYPDRVDSFSIGFEEDSFDESRYAKMVAEHVGTRHHELKLTDKMAMGMVANITDFLDEPFADSSLIPTYLLSRFAREKVKVVLGGDGGDELFAGYPTLVAHKMLRHYERYMPHTLHKHVVMNVVDRMGVSFDNISFDFRLRRFLSGRGIPLEARHHRWLGAFIDEEKSALLQDWVRPVLRDTYVRAYEHAADTRAQRHLNRVMYDDLKMYLEGDILFKVDRASMAASLEVRVPFLNRDVVDFVATIPFDLKLNGLTGKYILKKSVESLLPREIIYRKKKGFNMPVAYWLAGELRPLLLDMLSQTRIEQQGIFQYGGVKQLLDEHFAKKRDNRKKLWTLLMFQLWYDRYMTPIH